MWYIFLFILFYFVAKFFIRFIFPIVKLYYTANQKMKQMRNNTGGGTQEQYNNPNNGKAQPSKGKKGDYIDYVEIK